MREKWLQRAKRPRLCIAINGGNFERGSIFVPKEKVEEVKVARKSAQEFFDKDEELTFGPAKPASSVVQSKITSKDTKDDDASDDDVWVERSSSSRKKHKKDKKKKKKKKKSSKKKKRSRSSSDSDSSD